MTRKIPVNLEMIMFVFFLYALVATAVGADPPMVDMLFTSDASRSLENRQVVAVNSYMMRTNIKYSHPGLQPWLNSRGVQALRWPGGTPTNYYTTGRADRHWSRLDLPPPQKNPKKRFPAGSITFGQGCRLVASLARLH